MSGKDYVRPEDLEKSVDEVTEEVAEDSTDEETVEETVTEEDLDKALSNLEDALQELKKSDGDEDEDEDDDEDDSEAEDKEEDDVVEKSKKKVKKSDDYEDLSKALTEDEDIKTGFEVSDFLAAQTTQICKALDGLQKDTHSRIESQDSRIDSLVKAVAKQTEAVLALSESVDKYGDAPVGDLKKSVTSIDEVQAVEKGGTPEAPAAKSQINKGNLIKGLMKIIETDPTRLDVQEAVMRLEAAGDINKSLAEEAIEAL